MTSCIRYVIISLTVHKLATKVAHLFMMTCCLLFRRCSDSPSWWWRLSDVDSPSPIFSLHTSIFTTDEHSARVLKLWRLPSTLAVYSAGCGGWSRARWLLEKFSYADSLYAYNQGDSLARWKVSCALTITRGAFTLHCWLMIRLIKCLSPIVSLATE